MEQSRLITTEKTLSKNEIIALNEKFIRNYCKERGWNSNELTANQILEITTHKNYVKLRK